MRDRRTKHDRHLEYVRRRARIIGDAPTRRGHDGRLLVERQVVGVCCRCSREFAFVMTTRPRRYCPECADAVERERRANSNRVSALRKKQRRLNPPPPSPRHVRYAGYDPSERPLSEYEGESHD